MARNSTKTGGGPGTNGHAVRGKSQRRSDAGGSRDTARGLASAGFDLDPSRTPADDLAERISRSVGDAPIVSFSSDSSEQTDLLPRVLAHGESGHMWLDAGSEEESLRAAAAMKYYLRTGARLGTDGVMYNYDPEIGAAHVYIDFTKSNSDDFGARLWDYTDENPLSDFLTNGSSVRTTDRSGPGTKGTRAIEPFDASISVAYAETTSTPATSEAAPHSDPGTSTVEEAGMPSGIAIMEGALQRGLYERDLAETARRHGDTETALEHEAAADLWESVHRQIQGAV